MKQVGVKWNYLENNHQLPGVYHPAIEKILISKGIDTIEEMDEFLSKKPVKTYDPYLLRHMEKAVQRIHQALKKNEKIVFYGDYDVDGITSVALLIDFFFQFTKNIDYYIPMRQGEGYGLNREAIDQVKNEYGADLMITVDCGISASEEIEYAKSLDMDVIVTDHHTPGEKLPECLIINPKHRDCRYPYKDLCGCAIAFKLAQALQISLDLPKANLNRLLDLVAMATVCDVVPLVDENRTLVKYGLRMINKKQRTGLRVLLEKITMAEKEITTGHIGFMIGPHFNASGRMDDASLGVRLLMTQNEETAHQIASKLVELNKERKMIQDQGLETCQNLVEMKYSKDLFLIVEALDLHEGVIGIIAGRLRDLYYRPVIVMTPSEEPGFYTGSGRSVNGFHLFDELSGMAHLMHKFGGHANACGLTIHRDNIHLLRKGLNQRIQKQLLEEPEMLMKKINIYAEIQPEKLTEAFIDQLTRLEPFGMGNEKPLFTMKNLSTCDDSQVFSMGNEKQHIKICKFLQEEEKVNDRIEILGFGYTDEAKKVINQSDCFDLIFYPQINEWRGKKTLQLLITDMKSAENGLSQKCI